MIRSRQDHISLRGTLQWQKKAAAYRLAKLSLTLRGISHNLGETNDSRFAHALHKGLYFDYMMANPPV
jgi:type I restriction enzyme M protein